MRMRDDHSFFSTTRREEAEGSTIQEVKHHRRMEQRNRERGRIQPNLNEEGSATFKLHGDS